MGDTRSVDHSSYAVRCPVGQRNSLRPGSVEPGAEIGVQEEGWGAWGVEIIRVRV